jgi:hypothetical protein
MMNPATRSSSELNDFTNMVKQYSNNNWSGYWVKLRDGTLVRPIFEEAEDETCEDMFCQKNEHRIQFVWNPDGTSITSYHYDMMEIVHHG